MTKEELDREVAEKIEDLRIFLQARDDLFRRIQFVKDSSTSYMPLYEWAGAHAVMNTLDVVIHNMERLVDELKAMLPEEPVLKPQRPQLKLVKNGED